MPNFFWRLILSMLVAFAGVTAAQGRGALVAEGDDLGHQQIHGEWVGLVSFPDPTRVVLQVIFVSNKPQIKYYSQVKLAAVDKAGHPVRISKAKERESYLPYAGNANACVGLYILDVPGGGLRKIMVGWMGEVVQFTLDQ